VTPRATYLDPKAVNSSSKLLLKQHLFSQLIGEWLRFVSTLIGVRVALSEGHVAITDARDGDHDGPHLKRGGHYKKIAKDVDLFVDCTDVNPGGVYVSAGSHPMWKLLGETWESMHPLCRWGGRFNDANHLSLEDEGVA